MKLAVTSQGKELSSDVDPRFGRASFFIVVDTDTDEVTVHDNSRNLNASHGAGTQAAQTVASFGVDAVVTGDIGPNAYIALQAIEIKTYVGATGSVADAVEKVKTHELELHTPDAPGRGKQS